MTNEAIARQPNPDVAVVVRHDIGDLTAGFERHDDSSVAIMVYT